jgi:hypothetical protein
MSMLGLAELTLGRPTTLLSCSNRDLELTDTEILQSKTWEC